MNRRNMFAQAMRDRVLGPKSRRQLEVEELESRNPAKQAGPKRLVISQIRRSKRELPAVSGEVSFEDVRKY